VKIVNQSLPTPKFTLKDVPVGECFVFPNAVGIPHIRCTPFSEDDYTAYCVNLSDGVAHLEDLSVEVIPVDSYLLFQGEN
jgi:hypothetical protein